MAYKRQFVKDFAVNNPITTTVVVVVGGFLAYKGISRLITGGSGKGNGGKKPLPPIPPVPSKPDPNKSGATQYTYGAQQYADFADVLHEAMQPLGTEEETISEVLARLKTYDDVLAVIDAYGKRSLREWYGGMSKPYTLSQSFYAELEPDDIDKYVNTPLKKTGYKF